MDAKLEIKFVWHSMIGLVYLAPSLHFASPLGWMKRVWCVLFCFQLRNASHLFFSVPAEHICRQLHVESILSYCVLFFLSLCHVLCYLLVSSRENAFWFYLNEPSRSTTLDSCWIAVSVQPSSGHCNSELQPPPITLSPPPPHSLPPNPTTTNTISIS